MKVFELTAHVKSISRADGRSVTAAAAYRACCEIACEREGRIHDYSRKTGLEAAEIIVPDQAPEWAKDRAKLWNAAELRERNKDKRAKTADKANARPARELLFSFPVELSEAGRLDAARSIARHLAETHGVAADFAIHRPGREGDERNFHCHLMWTARRLTQDGFGQKTREWDDLRSGGKLVKSLRAFVANTLNNALAAEGKASSVHVEHRSFKERGESGKATSHEGPGRTNVQRRVRAQARTAWQRTARAAQAERHREERARLAGGQDAALKARLDHLAERERLGVSRFHDELDRDRAAERTQGGVRRAFDVMTGRAARIDAARVQRDADRVRAVDRGIAELKATIEAERAAYERDQRQDAKDMAERHTAEDRQIERAMAARVTADRIAEVQGRRDRVDARQQTHEHERGLSR